MINKVVISTDCVCDLPQELVEKYSIPIMYYYMQVGDARFQDINEINSDSILEYFVHGEKEIRTACATMQEYHQFFKRVSENDTKAVIHISMAEHVSDGYMNATYAAKDFDNVSVVDSGKVSGAMGMFVLVAADMAQKGATRDIILQKLQGLGEKISCNFIPNSFHCMKPNNKVDKALIRLLEGTSLQPIMTMKNSRFSFAGISCGNKWQKIDQFINKCFRNKDRMSDEVVFIVLAGCEYDVRHQVVEAVKKQMEWKHMYVLRASATVCSNCGAGTFGVAYFNK